jgi:phosphoribosyl-AMP cyclohydrolase / phosphoribosyl-ATP pyrophosphohydrolase
MTFDIDELDFAKSGGKVTVVTQHAITGVVLMVAQADRIAIEKTLETGEMHYTSRTRGLWHKGSTSGNTQRVVSLAADCDADSVLARVVPAGPACHTGRPSCFEDNASDIVAELDAVIARRAGTSDEGDVKSYTRRLLADRNLRMKKIGEESVELVLALADEDNPRAKEEAADLIYHVLVALRSAGISYDEVREVLAARRSV